MKIQFQIVNFMIYQNAKKTNSFQLLKNAKNENNWKDSGNPEKLF